MIWVSQVPCISSQKQDADGNAELYRQVPTVRPDTFSGQKPWMRSKNPDVLFWKVLMWQMLQGGAIQKQNSQAAREYVVSLTLTSYGDDSGKDEICRSYTEQCRKTDRNRL